jgi:hypothetical protein
MNQYEDRDWIEGWIDEQLLPEIVNSNKDFVKIWQFVVMLEHHVEKSNLHDEWLAHVCESI